MSYQALLFCPDEKTARVVTQVLTELDFTVEPCNETFAAVKKLMARHFDAIVVDCDNEQNATLLFKSARNSAPNQSSLSVAVVEGQAGVAKAFRIGANLVLTKPINVEQSKGTLRVARGLLRKADASKPAGASTPAAQTSSPAVAGLNSARPEGSPAFSGSPTFPERSVAPFPGMSAKPTGGMQDSGTSGFELEEEESPKPEPAEAALLESLPDLPRAKSPAFSTKELPRQPISMPAPSEESARPEASLRAAPKTLATEKTVSQPLGFGDPKRAGEGSAPGVASFNSGSAAAPAPAKEVSRPTIRPIEAKVTAPKESNSAVTASTIPTTAPAVEPLMFSALSVKDHEAGSEGSSKKPFLFVMAALLLIAGGYVGWMRFHPSFGQQTTQPATQAAVSAPTPAPVQAETQTPLTAPTTAAPASHESAPVIAPDSTRSLQAGTTIASSAKPTPATKAPPPEPQPSTAVKVSSPAPAAAQPLVIKNDLPRQAAPKQSVAEAAPPVAPAALGIGTNNDDKAIAGIMSSAPVAVPKPAVQTLRISQGVSQGLLAKRVQPIYPPTAMQMRLQGSVLLDAMIGKDGSIVSVKRISGDNILARAAIDAVKQWKYKPYYLNGEPVEIGTQITVNFKLP